MAHIQNAVRSNSQIDGLIINGQHVGFLQSTGLLSPVDDIVDTADLQPSALDPFKIEDVVNDDTTSSAVVSVDVAGADRPYRYRTIDEDRWLGAAVSVVVPPRSAAMVIPEG